MRELPKGWELEPLANICLKVTDGTHDSPKPVKEGFPLVTGKNIKNGKINFSGCNLISAEDHKEVIKRSKPEEGDVLFTNIGTLGEVAFVSKGPEFSIKNVALLKPGSKINGKFLYYYLASPHGKKTLEPIISGSSQRFLGLDVLRKFTIPVPPIDIQQTIVTILDKAEETKRLRARANELAQTLLRSVFLEMFGDPVKNPKGWNLRTLVSISTNFDGRRVPLKESDRDQMHGEYPYYGASGIIDFVDKFLYEGDYLLVAEDGANLLARSTPIAFQAHGQFWVNNHAHVIQAKDNIPPSYLETILNLIDITKYVNGSAQPKLTQDALNRILIPVPPIPLLLSFDNLATRYRLLMLKQEEHISCLSSFFDMLLVRAFTGELVA